MSLKAQIVFSFFLIARDLHLYRRGFFFLKTPPYIHMNERQIFVLDHLRKGHELNHKLLIAHLDAIKICTSWQCLTKKPLESTPLL